MLGDERVVSSQLVEIEAFRAVDRERLLGNLNDAETARKRKELVDLLAMLDLAAIDHRSREEPLRGERPCARRDSRRNRRDPGR